MKVKLLDNFAKIPTRGSEFAAGYDLYSSQRAIIQSGKRSMVSTGISVELPKGHFARISPRSGLAVKNGIDVMAGVIDEDYRGELKVVLYNTDKNDFMINIGDRIAQLIIIPYFTPNIVITSDLNYTQRGDNGFGSTGI